MERGHDLGLAFGREDAVDHRRRPAHFHVNVLAALLDSELHELQRFMGGIVREPPALRNGAHRKQDGQSSGQLLEDTQLLPDIVDGRNSDRWGTQQIHSEFPAVSSVADFLETISCQFQIGEFEGYNVCPQAGRVSRRNQVHVESWVTVLLIVCRPIDAHASSHSLYTVDSWIICKMDPRESLILRALLLQVSLMMWTGITPPPAKLDSQ